MNTARKRFTTEEILPPQNSAPVVPQQPQPVPEQPIQQGVPVVPQQTNVSQLTPTPQPLVNQPIPPVGSSIIIKKESGLTGISWRFIIPAVIVILGIILAAVFVPRLLNPAPAAVVATPIPTLVPATPIPEPEMLPRSKDYYNIDKRMSFEYLSSFTIVECEQKILFLRAKPESVDETCAAEHAGVLEIWTNDIEVPFAEYPDARYELREAEDYRYVFALLDTEYTLLFDRIINSFQVIDPNITDGWETYRSGLGYLVQYPPEWILIPSEDRENSSVTDIRKNVEESRIHNWAIKYTSVSNAGVSASGIMSSLQNLSGWKSRPSIEFRILDGEVAQILQGEYENIWQTNVVVWKGTSLVEMTWVDQVAQPERLRFEAMLSSFEFTD